MNKQQIIDDANKSAARKRTKFLEQLASSVIGEKLAKQTLDDIENQRLAIIAYAETLN